MVQSRHAPPLRIREATRKKPLTKVIAVDVDDTLLISGKINEELVVWCRARKCEGFKLILWSQAGEVHARNVARRAGIVDLFHVIIGKPGYIVDDKGWGWTKFTRRVTKWQTKS